MINRITAGLVIAALAAGTLLGYRLAPQKTVEIEKEVIRNNIVTRIVTKPDDSTETTTTDTSTIKKDSSTSTVIPPAQKVVTVSATVQSYLDNVKPVYGLLVQKTVLAPINLSVGVGLNTDKQAMLTLGWTF